MTPVYAKIIFRKFLTKLFTDGIVLTIMKFNGRFKDLIPVGYRFTYLFSRRYATYVFGERCDRIWIFRAKSDEQVELNDYYQHSGNVINTVLSGGNRELFLNRDSGEVLECVDNPLREHQPVILSDDTYKELARLRSIGAI
jgi:hypothetical protein